MLPGFLTTALEIIIILDVCGAIAYFTLTGLTRIKNRAEDSPTPTKQSHAPIGLPAFGFHTTGLTPALDSVPAQSPTPVYTPGPEPNVGHPWTAGFKRRFDALKQRFTYRPAANGQVVETRRVDADFDKLGRVLDSFKEEA